jgi:hypothetical protein
MNYETSAFAPFQMDTPTNIGGVEHAMVQAATIANEKGCMVVLGIRPATKRWEDAVPLVFTPGNLNEAIETVKGTLERVRNKLFLVGDVFPEVQIYLLYGAYVGNLLSKSDWETKMPKPMHCTMTNLQRLLAESGEVKMS